jgi:putative addiction module component (TIGR02574 family)
MSTMLKEIEKQLRALDAADRARLVELLLDTLRETSLGEVEEAWDKEIERRVSAYERGEMQTFSAEDVFAEARRLAR